MDRAIAKGEMESAWMECAPGPLAGVLTARPAHIDATCVIEQHGSRFGEDALPVVRGIRIGPEGPPPAVCLGG